MFYRRRLFVCPGVGCWRWRTAAVAPDVPRVPRRGDRHRV